MATPPEIEAASARRSPTLAVILVNYNGWPDVDRVVAGLTAEPEFHSGRFEIVVVDNASRGPIPDRFTSLPRGVRLLIRPDNGGFAVGVNAGWRMAGGAWLLILNPDVEIERGWIGQVLGRIADYDLRPAGPPGIVGFGLRNPDGTTQGSVGVFPTLGRTIREQFIPRSRRKYQAGWRIRPGRVDWVTGACMLLNAEMLNSVGGMDEDFFLYHEEVALSRTAQDRGWSVEYDPGLGVVHRHPLQDRAISPKMRVIIRHSKLLYFWKHLPGRQFRGILAMVQAEAMVRGAVARRLGRDAEARAWRTIRSIAVGFRNGNPVRGREVLRLAEDAEAGPGPDRPGPPRRDLAGRHDAGPRQAKGRIRVPRHHHLARLGLLMAAAASLLTWLAAHTDVMYADGLRYINQARRLETARWKDSLAQGTDHPAYPLAIAAVHRVRGGDGPADWQAAAQIASVVAGILLVVPIYLLSLELLGPTAAWLACVLTFLVPLTGHVLADVLSEGLFLLFWMFGCWAALRFLRAGATCWLLAAVAFAVLAYLVRPEGLVLPAALAATLLVALIIPAMRLPRCRAIRGALILLVAPTLLVGPFLVLKGGVATKPAIGRLFGLAGKSSAMAVERERPLDPGQSAVTTYAAASRAVFRAITGSVSPILLLPAAIGLVRGFRRRDDARRSVFLGIVIAAWILAMLRLHVTGGYCTSRHAMLLALLLISLAADGLNVLADRVASILHDRLRVNVPNRAVLTATLLTIVALSWPSLIAPVNAAFATYRPAGEWLAANTSPDARILDLKGWASFYGGRQGYGFGEIDDALRDPNLRWVVAHDAFLIGPWSYCDIIRGAVAGKARVKSFPERPRRGVAQVHIYDRSIPEAEAPIAAGLSSRDEKTIR